MVLFGYKMSKRIFAFFIIYPLIASSITVETIAQPAPRTEINWNDDERVKEALKKDPSLIGQNFENAQTFIIKNKQFAL